MMQDVNYYDVLGVLSTADDFVIKAVYRALAQHYHPDKFNENKKDAADAQAKMSQLNEAYQVLSDPAKRRDYDAYLQQGAHQNQQSRQQKSNQAKQQEDWAIALDFYPDLTNLETRLSKIDPSLIAEFRSSLLASQQYEQRKVVANQLEQNYLEDYFGNDVLIIDFARDLLLAGKRDGAKELNRIIKVVGGGISSEKIIDQIEAKYLPQRKADRHQRTADRKEKEKDNIQFQASIKGYIRWDAYLKKYNITERNLARAIKGGQLSFKLIKEKNLDNVTYVEDKAIDSLSILFWIAAVVTLVLIILVVSH